MHIPDVFYSFAKQETPAVCALIIRKHINLLQVKQVFSLLLYGYITRRFALLTGNEVHMPLFFHLLADAL